MVIACLSAACNSMEPEPTPGPASMTGGGPPVDQGAPVTGGQLFNGNY
jgi:hypothetical protein